MRDDDLVCRDAAALAAGLSEAGLDVDDLSRRAGYPERFDRLSASELGDVFARLWPLACADARDPLLPLRVGDAIPFGTYEVVDYLASACSNVADALERIARYFRLITSDVHWHLEPSAQHLDVIVRCVVPGVDRVRASALYVLGVTFGRFRRLCKGPFRFEAVAFAFPPPPDHGALTAYFDCPLTFGAADTHVRLSKEVASLALERSEPTLRSILERHAAALLEEELAAVDPLAEVRQAVRARLEEGTPVVDEVAKAIATSPRTLQRRLRTEGTTFTRLVDRERRRAAEAYLGDPRFAVADVAYLVGYRDPSAFVRAFRRWTGITPRQYRRGGVRG